MSVQGMHTLLAFIWFYLLFLLLPLSLKALHAWTQELGNTGQIVFIPGMDGHKRTGKKDIRWNGVDFRCGRVFPLSLAVFGCISNDKTFGVIARIQGSRP